MAAYVRIDVEHDEIALAAVEDEVAFIFCVICMKITKNTAAGF
jgi:hypothetical protein